MNIILFYAKPGCSTNLKQKKMLQKTGSLVIIRNLLELDMNKKELLVYLKNRPYEEWFNPNAPLIKNGQLNPAKLSPHEALDLLYSDPILIRRPLLNIAGHYLCGFDQKTIEDILGVPLQKKIDENCSSNTKRIPPLLFPSGSIKFTGLL